MGIFDTLFGSPGGATGTVKNQANQIIPDWLAASNAAWSPDAVRQRVASMSSNIYNNLGALEQSGRAGLASRGIASPNAALFSELPAYQVAHGADQIQQQAIQGRMQAILQRLGLLQGVNGITYHQPTQGIIPELAQAAGTYYGMSHGVPPHQTAQVNPGSNGNTDPDQPGNGGDGGGNSFMAHAPGGDLGIGPEPGPNASVDELLGYLKRKKDAEYAQFTREGAAPTSYGAPSSYGGSPSAFTATTGAGAAPDPYGGSGPQVGGFGNTMGAPAYHPTSDGQPWQPGVPQPVNGGAFPGTAPGQPARRQWFPRQPSGGPLGPRGYAYGGI